MLYLLAFLLPPLAILMCGRPFLAILSIPFTLLGWFPGVIFALIVVADSAAKVCNDKIVRAINRRGR